MKLRVAKKILKNQETLNYNKGQVKRATIASAQSARRAAKAEKK